MGGRAPVQVTLAESERRRGMPRGMRIAVIALAAAVSTAGVLVGVRVIAGTGDQSRPPADSLDAGKAGAPASIGSTRLAPIGPTVLLDSAATGTLAPGAEVTLPMPGLPAGTTTVVLEVSLVAATGPGAVTIGSDLGQVPVLRLPRAGAQTSTTTLARLGRDGGLTARTEGGGQLLVSLVAALEPAEASAAGRVVPVPATSLLRLVPERDGKDATIDLSGVPVLREAGDASAVLLQFTADVGRNGGSLAVGRSPGSFDQRLFWSASAGDDRTRAGFMLVPAGSGPVHLRYEAGSLLTADLVGYVTGERADRVATGLLVPVDPVASQAAPVPARGTADLAPRTGAVPDDRVAAVLATVSAVGDVAGGVTVYPPDSPAPANPVLSAGGGTARQVLTLVRTVNGNVRVGSVSGATVSLVTQAVVLT